MRTLAALGVALLLVAVTTACDGDDDARSAKSVRVLVYLLRGEDVGAAARSIAADADAPAAAVEELLAGPTSEEAGAGLGTAIPPDTRLRSVTLAQGVATVDLSREFESGGGSAVMFARLAQVVHTLTQFPSITGVQFAIDGAPVTVFSAEGIELDGPQDRADYEDQSPSVLVEEPVVGDTITDRFRLRGTSNTFEATFEYEVLAPDGTKLAGTFVTATCGTGCRGTFDEEVVLDPTDAGEVTLVVFERSAEDGSRINEVPIPLTLG